MKAYFINFLRKNIELKQKVLKLIVFNSIIYKKLKFNRISSEKKIFHLKFYETKKDMYMKYKEKVKMTYIFIQLLYKLLN